MILEVAGKEYQGFVSASVNIRLDALSNTFGFQITSEDGNPLPFRGGEAAKVIIDNELVLTGFIELVNVDGEPTDHNINITGRDKTGDLLDSSIGTLDDIRAPISLKRIIELVIAHIDADIDVVEDTETVLFNTAEDLIAPESGDNAFDFIERLARKRQVLLTSNPDGDVVIARSSGLEIGARLINNPANNSNNVLSYSVSYDTTGRFNVYRMASQRNPTTIAQSGGVPNVVATSQITEKSDDSIREGRQFVLTAENMSSVGEQARRLEWEMNIRRARGRVYSVTVNGHRNSDGELWDINRLVKVEDTFAGINSKMLINGVTFKLNNDLGRQTTLSLVEENAYTLEITEPVPKEMGIGLTNY